MNQTYRRLIPIFGLLSLLLASSAFVTPVFAHSDALSTQLTNAAHTPTTSYIQGATITDTATLCVNDFSGIACSVTVSQPLSYACQDTYTTDPDGKLCFRVFQGVCGDFGAATATQPVFTTFKVINDENISTYVTSLDTTTLPASPTGTHYLFLVEFNGTKANPDMPTLLTCEPFTLTSKPPPTGAPEFPMGSIVMIALAIPALLLIRGKFSKTVGPQIP